MIAKYAAGDPLPNWTVFDKDGRVHHTRAIDEFARKARRLFSIVILEISWSSRPGFDWPDQYRVTWLPKQRKWILTASADTDELYGCTDFALGHFSGELGELVEKARPILLRHWRFLKREREQPPWEGVLDPALTGMEIANLWRKKVWPREP